MKELTETAVKAERLACQAICLGAVVFHLELSASVEGPDQHRRDVHDRLASLAKQLAEEIEARSTK